MKVLPLSQDLLLEPLLRALRHPEPAWSGPRAAFPGYGAAPGARRCVIFSGLDSGERSALVNCLEARGLPRIVAASVTAGNSRDACGEVVAKALRADKRYVRCVQFPV